jgi:hypothetical protein
MKIKPDEIEKESWMMIQTILGHIAMWAVRQSPYHSPDGLLEVLNEFNRRVASRFDSNGMVKMTNKELEKMLWDNLTQIHQFNLWNERKNGNQSPYGFVDRYTKPNPDNDFIDLHALVRNVRLSVQRENERDEVFNSNFDRQWRRGRFMRFVRGLKYKLFPSLYVCTPCNPTIQPQTPAP